MNRYEVGHTVGDEYEPGSRRRVLRNFHGIKKIREANAVETELLAIAYVDSLKWMDTNTRFTAKLITEMHRIWLERFYPMAGRYRTVDLSKGGFTFCHALYVPNEMERFESEELARCTPCAGSLTQVAELIAVAHAELLMIHPYREGNGRLARWVSDLMALQAGFPAPDYNLRGAARGHYFAALRRAYLGDITDLAALFFSWIERASRQRPSKRRLK